MSNTPTPEKPLNELLSRAMVDIYVGPENTHWILHEKLLCYHSPFFRQIFYAKHRPSKSFGLPDEEDLPFKTFVGWLYSSSLPVPREESDLGLQFDLYLMAEKFQIAPLVADVLQVVREWYKYSDTYPGLRRVQYIYANTEEGSPMRHMLVHSVARLMVLERGIPAHWDKALRKNGQLAVDIIRAIQEWRLRDEVVPDAREEPGDNEDLIDTEEGVEAEGSGRSEGEEASNENEDERNVMDDSEATIVDSPTGPQRQQQQKDGVEKKVEDSKKRADDLVGGFKQMKMQSMPNGVSGGNYGTLKA